MREIVSFTERPGSARGLLARLYLASGEIGYRANFSAAAYTVTDLTNGGTPATGSLSVAAVLFTALQTPWGVDEIGYTFKWPAPGSLWPTAASTYFIDVVLTGTDGNTYKLSWQVTTTAR